jgi:hypothetical protein
MFPRRTLQAILDELSEIISVAELKDIVGRLNSPRDRLPMIWEVAVLCGLSRVGKIAYQAPLPSGRKPDVTFSIPGTKVGFVADITTVSDAGYHKDNPVEAFSDDLLRIVGKFGLDPNHFYFHVEDQPVQEGQKIKLKLPKRGTNEAVLKKHVLPFLREIEVSGRTEHNLIINEPDVSVTVSYDRSGRFMGGGHRVYTQTRSIEQNPLWRRLEEKAGQVRNSGGLLRGIIVCDGGCALLSGRMRELKSFSVDADDIIRKFFRKRTSVDFVYTITARDRGTSLGAKCTFLGQVWTRDPATKSPLASVLQKMLEKLPAPIFDAHNTARRAQQTGLNVGPRESFGISLSGGHIVSAHMSNRVLLEILAGKHSPSEIDLLFQAGFPNPFKRALAEGWLITDISIERADDKNDDRVTIKFGGPDAAVSPFRSK